MQRPSRFDLTVVVNYYTPYVSGLTETVRRLAEGLAARGWTVAAVAARHDPSLPKYEVLNGVHVFRCPVVARVSRGLVSPSFPFVAARLARQSTLLHLNVPMLEAGLIARLARRTPIVTMVHIDLWLPDGVVNRIAMRLTDGTARAAIRRSGAVVTYSEDQARGSSLWPLMRKRRLVGIPAPCRDRSGGRAVYRETSGLHVGFMGRIVEEKGIEYLVRAFRHHLTDPDARLLIAGDYLTVAGGSNIDRVTAAIRDDSRIRILGLLSGDQLDDFYASIDVFALPSIAESFGIVQAEAMMAGVPSVTTDLPGGRYPVTATGFGRVVPPRDVVALAKAIEEMYAETDGWRTEKAQLARSMFSVDACLDSYEDLFRAVVDR